MVTMAERRIMRTRPMATRHTRHITAAKLRRITWKSTVILTTSDTRSCLCPLIAARPIGSEFLRGLFRNRRVDNALDRHAGVLQQFHFLEEDKVIAQAVQVPPPVRVDSGRRGIGVPLGVLDDGGLD